LASYTIPKLMMKDFPRGIVKEDNGIELKKPQHIIDREDDYRTRKLNIIIHPDINNSLAMGNMTLNDIVLT
jgi:hypothetical protein